MKNKQNGFVIPIIIITIALLAIGVGAYLYTNNNVKAPKSEENNILSNKQQVENLLVQMLDQPLYDNEITIQKENDNYIVGQASVGEGGFSVMAAKVDNKWEFVYIGNEFANCDKLAEYNFPQDFLPSYCNCNDKFYQEQYSELIRPKYCLNIYTNTKYGFKVEYNKDWVFDEAGSDKSLVIFHPKIVGSSYNVGFKIYYWSTFPDIGVISSISELKEAVEQKFSTYHPKIRIDKVGGFDVVIVEGLPGLIDNESEAYILLDNNVGVLSVYPGNYVQTIHKI